MSLQPNLPSILTFVGDEAVARLQHRGFGTGAEVAESLAVGASAYRAAHSPNYPISYAGGRMWGETIGHLLPGLAPLGWEAADVSGLRFAHLPSKGLALLVVAGNPATGSVRYVPQARYPRGDVSTQLVNENQGVLFGERIDGHPVWDVWFLLHNVSSVGVSAEVSWPAGVSRSGYVTSWHERIVLPFIGFGPEGGTRIPAPAAGVSHSDHRTSSRMTPSFCPERLKLARQRNRLTKIELGRRVDLSVRRIAAFENEDAEPPAETLADGGTAGYPEAFFFKECIGQVVAESVSFRSFSRMAARDRDAALAAASLASELSFWLGNRFTLPPHDFPDLRDADPDFAAAALRSEWGLGVGPAPNMMRLLEAKGVRVFAVVHDCAALDALSTWVEGTPFVFLSQAKSAERSRVGLCTRVGALGLAPRPTNNPRARERSRCVCGGVPSPEGRLRSVGAENCVATRCAVEQGRVARLGGCVDTQSL